MTCFDLTASARRPGPARTTTDYSTVDEGFALPAAPGAAQRPATMHRFQRTIHQAPTLYSLLCAAVHAIKRHDPRWYRRSAFAGRLYKMQLGG
jgi:hypothetical protein